MAEALKTDARSLLSAAEAVFDDCEALSAQAAGAWRGGFASGATWMGSALQRVRSQPLAGTACAFQAYGVVKYALASTVAIAFAAVAIRAGWPIVGAAGGILLFYAVEARMVFLFPLLLDGSTHPWRDSLRWTRRAGGTFRVMCTVMRLAATMIFGGVAGGGFVRCWCLGCLAVCIWYERVRISALPGADPRLEVGTGGPMHLRRERVEGWHLPRPLRILYVSDLHLGRVWTRSVGGQVVGAARAARADVILLGGDLLDSARGAPLLRRCVAALQRLAPVYAVAGNHDRRAGVDRVREAVTGAGGTWLVEPVLICGGQVELISGADGRSHGRRSILCAHDPSVFASAARAGVDLVFAGHLHGGQCVLFQRGTKLYPGAWFAGWTGLRFEREGSTLLVSRGAGDTLPVRWNCPREVIVCEIL